MPALNHRHRGPVPARKRPGPADAAREERLPCRAAKRPARRPKGRTAGALPAHVSRVAPCHGPDGPPGRSMRSELITMMSCRPPPSAVSPTRSSAGLAGTLSPHTPRRHCKRGHGRDDHQDAAPSSRPGTLALHSESPESFSWPRREGGRDLSGDELPHCASRHAFRPDLVLTGASYQAPQAGLPRALSGAKPRAVKIRPVLAGRILTALAVAARMPSPGAPHRARPAFGGVRRRPARTPARRPSPPRWASRPRGTRTARTGGAAVAAPTSWPGPAAASWPARAGSGRSSRPRSGR